MNASVAYRRLFSRFGAQGWWPISGHYRKGRKALPTPREAFEICVGAVLTQNTAWTNVETALSALKSADWLTPQALREVRLPGLQRCIRSSGYFVQKSKKLKILARWTTNGALSRLRRAPLMEIRQELLGLWGVGPETADSILLYAGGRKIFVVDAYTKRIGSRVGWFGPSASYDEMQAFFTKSLKPSAKIYNETHALFVKLAKKHCRSTPDCTACPLKSGCAVGRSHE